MPPATNCLTSPDDAIVESAVVKISFLCFELSDNSLARAWLLARALSNRYEVELIGPCRGAGIWPPLKETSITVKRYPWSRLPMYLSTMRQMAREIDGDILFACKPRLTSFGLGLLAKRLTGKPLIVDIDDWELGFFYHTDFWGKLGRFLNLSNPNGLPYTWLMERLTGRADAIVVSNRFLQNCFSGELIYHARDTTELDPARFDPGPLRKKLGLENKKAVMFLGTPRSHKGMDDLLEALQLTKTPDVQLVFVGVDDNHKLRRIENPEIKKRLTLVGKVPFDELGAYLSAADILAIPQRETTDTVGQMPAKIFDAMAMAKPIISSRVSDIPEVLGDCGYLIDPGDARQLAQTIDHIFANPDEARLKGEKARERCRSLYDIKTAEEQLVRLIESLTS